MADLNYIQKLKYKLQIWECQGLPKTLKSIHIRITSTYPFIDKDLTFVCISCIIGGITGFYYTSFI